MGLDLPGNPGCVCYLFVNMEGMEILRWVPDEGTNHCDDNKIMPISFHQQWH